MAKALKILFLLITGYNQASSQSFFLNYPTKNAVAHCNYADDAIYFIYFNSVIKTAYSGGMIWSKQLPITRMVINQNYIYATDTSAQLVIKLDTSGNIVWTKKLSTLVYNGTTYKNTIADLMCDGFKLFVAVNQMAPRQCGTCDDYYSILTLDSGGNFLQS